MTASDERTLRILHLSDTHLFGDETLHYGVVDTGAALHRVLERASEIDAIDLVVASGDLSDDGTDASYRRLRELIEPWAAERGAAVVYAMGNHDGRDAFERVLGAREAVTELHAFRVITLDSSVPGAGYGELDGGQLEWLRAQLRGHLCGDGGGFDKDGRGTVLVVHHPPVPAATTLLRALQLQNPGELLAVAAASDVRVILGGHYHHSLVQEAAGIVVIVAPGITNTSDAIAPAGRERATVGAGFAIVEVPAAGEVRVAFVAAPGPDDGTLIFDLGEAEVARIAAAAGPAT